VTAGLSDGSAHRELLKRTDELLERIERLRLGAVPKLPSSVRSDLEQVARQVTSFEQRAPESLSGAHAQVFRLQERLLGSNRSVSRTSVFLPRVGSAAVREFRLPRRDPAAYLGEWRDQARPIVQRAHDRWLLISAQAVAARSLPEAPVELAELRAKQAEAAWRNLDELARHFLRVVGEPAHIDPVPTLPAAGRFRIGSISISMEARRATRSGSPIRFTPVEWKCLSVLVAAAGKAVSREGLMLVATGADPRTSPETRAVDVHIAHLRAKLGSTTVETVGEVGYRIGSKMERVPAQGAGELRRRLLERRSRERTVPPTAAAVSWQRVEKLGRRERSR
jgi:DNA-binding winged helix-turn-helix (wHTH) protein